MKIVRDWATWQENACKEYEGTPWEATFRAIEDDILACQKAGNAEALEVAKEQWIQEKFAVGFENYVQEGKAPDSSLQSVFSKFKQYLTEIYGALTQSEITKCTLYPHS